MQTESQVVAIGHVIQLAVAPVFLLTGVSGLLTVLTNRLARIIGLGRAKELTLLNDHVTPEAALAMGLVNWVVDPAGVDAALAGVVEKAFHSSRTATGHAKRLLHASFHRDPREMIEEVMRAQHECMTSWEMEQANRAWDERREPRFYPPPARPGPDGRGGSAASGSAR